MRAYIALAELPVYSGLDFRYRLAIVERAGVNERMIYHHFGSKDGLYRAVLEDQWLGLAEAWTLIIAEATTLAPRAGLTLAFVGLARLIRDRPLILALAIHEALTGWQASPATTLSEAPAGLRSVFERGQADGTFRADVTFDVVYLSSLTSITIIGPRFTDFRQRSTADASYAEQVGQQTVDLLLDGAAKTCESGA